MEQPNPDMPLPALGALTLAHDAEYVAGFPVHVALTLAGDPIHAMPRLPNPDWRALHGAVGLTLADAADPSRVLLRAEARPLVDEEIRSPKVDLPRGASVRMLVDLNDRLAGAAKPGSYVATVEYAADRSPALRRAATFPLTLRRPTAGEQHVLAALAAASRDGWGAWATAKPRDPAEGALLTGRVDPDDPLRFLRIMRFLMYGSAPLADVDLATLDTLGGVYAPDAEALRGEVLAARGDQAALQATLARARAATPGLWPWLDAIETRTTFLGWVRKHRA
jgi:hypothetical protein